MWLTEMRSPVRCRWFSRRGLDINNPPFFIEQIDLAADGDASDFAGNIDLGGRRLNPRRRLVHVFGYELLTDFADRARILIVPERRFRHLVLPLRTEQRHDAER